MEKTETQPWQQLEDLLAQGDASDIEACLDTMEPAELVRSIFRLDEAKQQKLLRTISTDAAVDIIEEMPETQAAELLDDLSAEEAANILTGLASDEKADVLNEMDTDDAAAILDAMGKKEADESRLLLQYAPNVAGGLMQTEYITYSRKRSVKQVLEDMSARQDEYAQYSAPYIYVTAPGRRLVGILRVRDLVFANPDVLLEDMAIEAISVNPQTSVSELETFFNEHEINVVPVVEPHTGAVIGVVRRRSVNKALADRSEAERLRQAGIVGGEEFRSMPITTRSGRRLSWLSINVVLNIIAASVIAMYQDTLSAVIALAVFLPIVSDMSGCSGNQAVAVSLRELSLGIVVPKDLMRVWRQEAIVGVINGIALGALIALVALLWKGNPWLGLVVGGALAINTIIAVSIGGTVPLILRSLKIDPAVAAGPILTTVTDMCGFALVLGLATLALPLIT